jgi:hypothetical protein
VLAQGALGAVKDPFTQINVSLNQILDVISPDEPQPVKLTTGLLGKGPNDFVFCSLVNFGSSPFVVLTNSIKMRDPLGGIVAQNSISLTLNPGQGFSSGTSGGTLLRCEFSFVGFANDVRATGQVQDGTGRATAVLEAR